MDALTRAGFLAHSHTNAYRRRIQAAVDNIKIAIADGTKKYIAFSTGKDSLVMADLVYAQAPDIAWVYMDADSAYPETNEMLEHYKKIRGLYINVTESMFAAMHRAGGPTAKNCERITMEATVNAPVKVMQERGYTGAFVGLRKSENVYRATLPARYGVCHTRKDGFTNYWPILNLTFEDVWAYIVSNNLVYNKIYDKLSAMGVELSQARVSYWAGESSHHLGRWGVLRVGWPELYARLADEFPEVQSWT